jgi:hypothetical protein
MSEDPQMPSQEESEISCEELFKKCQDLGKQIEALADRLADGALVFDPLGDFKSHPEGSARRRFAQLRDHADMCLSEAARHLMTLVRIRAETSQSVDLIVDAIAVARGDGDECLRLIRLFHERTGDEKEGLSTIDDCTFPSSFLEDLYKRVEAFPSLAARYPEHMSFAAKRFQGLPMLFSLHIDNSMEFLRLAEDLGLGKWHPLDVSGRRKRGGRTPAMTYLEPLVCRLADFRDIMLWIASRETEPITSKRMADAWQTSVFAEKTSYAVVEVLRKVPSLPVLTKSAAPAWSKNAIVPYILVTDGADPANAEHPFLRNIWNHRGVKSIATFRSRLESAVTDFLTRYSREDEPSSPS